MRNSNSWTYKDKEITELSRTHHQTDDSSDEADGGDYGFQALSSDSIQLRPKHKPTRVSLRVFPLPHYNFVFLFQFRGISCF